LTQAASITITKAKWGWKIDHGEPAGTLQRYHLCLGVKGKVIAEF
jgi:hypothetical protein